MLFNFCFGVIMCYVGWCFFCCVVGVVNQMFYFVFDGEIGDGYFVVYFLFIGYCFFW